MAEHFDRGYRLLFSFPRMVEDLLRRFVGAAWIEKLDFATLEKVSERDISDRRIRREKDLIWRLRYRPGAGDPDGWFYVYIHLEFQSTPRPFMPLDIAVYKLLLYQDLVRRGKLTASGKLPHVFSIVLYNGKAKWSAPLSLLEQIEPLPSEAGVAVDIQSVLSYRLIDEKGYPPAKLEQLHTPVATLFQLEQSRSLDELRRSVARLLEELSGPEQLALREAFAALINEALLPTLAPEASLPELSDLKELKMLKESAIEWRNEWLQTGRKKGRREGRQEARREFLVHQLKLKFGRLSAATRARLDAATASELLLWAERVLTAQTIDQVFQK